MSDIAWGISGEDALNLHRKGEVVKAIVLDIDVEKERISLGMKQLEKGAPGVGAVSGGGSGGLNKNQTVTVTVLEVRDGGLEVQAGEDGATGFIKRSDLGRDRDEQRPSASSPARSSTRWSSASIAARSPTSRSRRCRSPKKSRRWRSTVRPTAARRSAIFLAKR
jgi:ribosomal protein S1